ncbi:hypothetical protein J3R83DRAFT_11551 [Lanmaoa asiatica]|nr:hypothetical protein J3R83DRAFT_11551 [Lanmaoa asiatica]
MPTIHIIGPRSSGTDTQNTQSLLQHFYFIAAVAVVFALVILRIIFLRRHNQTLSDFFRFSSNSQHPYGSHPPNDTNYGSIYHGLQLAPLPAAYRPDRRIRAADTDAHGRRLGPAGEDWDGKDALPAYDNFDRPPKYIEASWTHGEPPLPTEQSAATPSPEGGQSGMVHPNTVDRVSADNVGQPFDYTHAVAGGPRDRSNITPSDPPRLA